MNVLGLVELYDRSGMMCDADFVLYIGKEMQDIFSIESLRELGIEFDTAYGGQFQIELSACEGFDTDYCMIRAIPLDEKFQPVKKCVCGTMYITQSDWAKALDALEEERQND